MYIFFDTETTGLPDSYDAPVSDLDNWPRVVQVAWEIFDPRGRRTAAQSYVVRPDGFEIPKEAARVHGISTAYAKRTGTPVAKVLAEFGEALTGASAVVAHNLSFDSKVIGAEFYRVGVRHPFRGKHQICTMEAATEFCALPGNYGYKWPKLDELHSKLFGKRLKDAHDAAADVATCAKCFFELQRLGVIRIGKRPRR
jgi:DNA polymerase III subunit epsilon